jgi:hypothetical protein
MGGINVGRWLAGGIAAGVVVWLFEGVASGLYMKDMQAELARHSLSMEISAELLAMGALMSLILGLTLVFFYAAARPRFGPGPKTAVIVGLALWVGGYLLSILGYQAIGLFPPSMLALWAGIGLVEMLAAALVGGAIYREG